MDSEGVIKFDLLHQHGALEKIDIGALRAWRRILFDLKMLGQDPRRYAGLGFGNVSMRTDHGFIVSGTQTGALSNPDLPSYAEVINWSLDANRIESRGLVKPSSESLTHAALYALHQDISFVFHVHSPEIWRDRVKFEPPMDMGAQDSDTGPGDAAGNVDVLKASLKASAGNVDVPETGEVAYGTPEMAREVERVCGGRELPSAFVMRGHEDGVVAYGRSAAEAGLLLVRLLAESLTN